MTVLKSDSFIYHLQSIPFKPSSRQCENAERVAGAGDVTKGAEALKGVSIPMFSAKGLAIRRANGEVVTPFYFAYEDLREDWGKLVEQAEAAAEASEEGEKSKSVSKLSSKPKVRSPHVGLCGVCVSPSRVIGTVSFLYLN